MINAGTPGEIRSLLQTPTCALLDIHANTADRCDLIAADLATIVERPARPQLHWLDRTESAQNRGTGAKASPGMPCISSQAPAYPATRLAFVLIDGLGDTNVSQLGDQTPLQAANTPILDGVAGDVLLFTAEPCHILLFLGCCMHVLEDSTKDLPLCSIAKVEKACAGLLNSAGLLIMQMC